MTIPKPHRAYSVKETLECFRTVLNNDITSAVTSETGIVKSYEANPWTWVTFTALLLESQNLKPLLVQIECEGKEHLFIEVHKNNERIFFGAQGVFNSIFTAMAAISLGEFSIEHAEAIRCAKILKKMEEEPLYNMYCGLESDKMARYCMLQELHNQLLVHWIKGLELDTFH